MEEIGLFNEYPVIQLISYIITLIFGGYGVKWYKERNEQHNTIKRIESSENQQLITNLTDRVDKLTDNVKKLEEERTEIHKRELERTKELAEANAKVTILTERVEHLQDTIEKLIKQNKNYKNKLKSLGALDE